MRAIDRRSALKLGALAMIPTLLPLSACARQGAAAGAGSAAPTSGSSQPLSLKNIRDAVIGIDELVELEDGSTKQAICFDNAATTPVLAPVLDEVCSEMRMYGSIGRGFAQKSDHSTDVYTKTRDKVLAFVGADPEVHTCFYVSNATDGMNKLASALVKSKDDVVLSTRIEHHSNDLPWRERCKVVYAEVDDQGRIDYDDMERLLKENKVSYVTVTAASNVTGYVTDVHRVAQLAHANGAKVIVDGAQIVAHRAFSMKGDGTNNDVDFFVFSAHKMYAPFGGGAVIGPASILDKCQPTFYGGGTVNIVADDWVEYKQAPAVYEAGSPNYPGVVALGKAIDVLQEVGFDDIQAHEQTLIRKLIDGLLEVDHVVVYGDTNDVSDRVGVVSFNIDDLNSHVLAKRLGASGAFATRRGAFCAHPYVWRLMKIPFDELRGFAECSDVNTPGMIRVSFGIYNTEEEVDEFLSFLPQAIEMAREDVNQYSRAEPAY